MNIASNQTATGTSPVSDKQGWLNSHEEGYEKSLKPRQIQMIAIGTGLFLGAGARL